MHTIRFSKEDRLWTVGFFDPKGKWQALSDHESQEAAAREAASLNGGGGTVRDELEALIKEQYDVEYKDVMAELRAEIREVEEQRDELRKLLADVLAGWKAAGCYGFVCRDQQGLVSLTSAIQAAKEKIG